MDKIEVKLSDFKYDSQDMKVEKGDHREERWGNQDKKLAKILPKIPNLVKNAQNWTGNGPVWFLYHTNIDGTHNFVRKFDFLDFSESNLFNFDSNMAKDRLKDVQNMGQIVHCGF